MARMRLRDLQLLVRVAETGSMTRAARQLHLSPAAVSGAIQRMEEELGLRLFDRTTRSVRPSDEGLVVVEGCRDLLARWHRVLDEARGEDAVLEGPIRLSAPADTTYAVLEDVVVALCDQHPGLQVVLDISDTVQPVHREAIDLAIRYGPLQDSRLTARKLVALPAVLVASPAYLAEEGTPTSPEALADHRCLTLQRDGAPTTTWRLRRAPPDDAVQEVALRRTLCADGHLVRSWSIEGRGIGLKNLFDVIDDLEAGRLVRVLPDHTGRLTPIHVVFPSRRFLPARVRALDAAITARFEARAARCHAWLTR